VLWGMIGTLVVASKHPPLYFHHRVTYIKLNHICTKRWNAMFRSMNVRTVLQFATFHLIFSPLENPWTDTVPSIMSWLTTSATYKSHPASSNLPEFPHPIYCIKLFVIESFLTTR
jgi:hypothetical protein